MVACVSRFALFFLLKVEGVALCLSCFDFGKGGGDGCLFILFNFFGGGRQAQPDNRGSDLRYNLEINLKEGFLLYGKLDYVRKRLLRNTWCNKKYRCKGH